MIAVFFVHGFLFASWTAHIPDLKQHLGLSDGRLGLALLGAPIGSVLAMALAARILPRVGSRKMVRLALLGYCVSGPFIGLTGSFGTFFVAFLALGLLPGNARRVDEHPSDHGRAVLRPSADAGLPRVVELRRPRRCSHGSIRGGAGPLSECAAARPGHTVPAGRRLAFDPDDPRPSGGRRPRILEEAVASGRHGVLQRELIVLGGIAFADMLCEGAAADWAAVYLRNSLHTVPLVAGMGFAIYALAMLAVRLSGNRLFTRFAAHRLLPLLAVIATLGFAGGLVIARPASVLVGFALLGAGLGSVVPMTLRAAGAVGNVNTGRAVASVAGCGWAGYVVGPVVIGAIASSTTLHTALFLIPVLTGIVAVGTWTAKGVRRSTRLAGAAPSPHTREPARTATGGSLAPSAGLEPAPPAPEAGALSAELRGRARTIRPDRRSRQR